MAGVRARKALRVSPILTMKFRPRLLPSIVALVLVTLGIAAGQWQSGRAEQKRVLKAHIEAAARLPAVALSDRPVEASALALRRVTARGEWVSDKTVLVDNRVLNGRPGYHVVTPLKVGNTHYLVNRGWAAAGRTRTELPVVTTPAGVVDVIGEARVPLKNAFSLGAGLTTDGKVWQQIQIDALSQSMKLPLSPIVIFEISTVSKRLFHSE